MIERSELMTRIRRALKRSRVVALIGPRQSGKTTLAREIVPAGSKNYFDLENPASLARLEQPLTALDGLSRSARRYRRAAWPRWTTPSSARTRSRWEQEADRSA